MAFFDCSGVRLMLSQPSSPDFDHPNIIYYSVDDIQGQPWRPKMVNIKPSRFGPLHALFAAYDYCDANGIRIPRGVCESLSDEQYRALYDATMVHVKPLANALGDQFRDILSPDKVLATFRRM